MRLAQRSGNGVVQGARDATNHLDADGFLTAIAHPFRDFATIPSGSP